MPDDVKSYIAQNDTWSSRFEAVVGLKVKALNDILDAMNPRLADLKVPIFNLSSGGHSHWLNPSSDEPWSSLVVGDEDCISPSS